MIKRLRPKWSDEELEKVYSEPYDHTQWSDHKLRVNVTVGIGWYLASECNTGADLSCGDGAIMKRLKFLRGVDKFYGDLKPHPGFLEGPIEETIHEIPKVDLFVCSETLEHLDDPAAVLQEIRVKTNYLLISTPIGETSDLNPQHYWGWDQEAIERLIRSAGFNKTLVQVDLKFPGMEYDYQIWLVS